VGKLRDVRDRLTGRFDDELSQAVLAWARASESLLDLVSTGSLVSQVDRHLLILLVNAALDSPTPF
jgi:hypothetical protein